MYKPTYSIPVNDGYMDIWMEESAQISGKKVQRWGSWSKDMSMFKHYQVFYGATLNFDAENRFYLPVFSLILTSPFV